MQLKLCSAKQADRQFDCISMQFYSLFSCYFPREPQGKRGRAGGSGKSIQTVCISGPGQQKALLQIKLLANLLWCWCWCVWPDTIAIRNFAIACLQQQVSSIHSNFFLYFFLHYVGFFLMKIKCCSGQPKAVHVLVQLSVSAAHSLEQQEYLADGNAQRQ